jgi:8-oxo-dGTP pyrophosphatase MutT (NUDIX family)
MSNGHVPRWLAWAREIQALSQTGLAFASNDYETQRYRRLAEIAAEIVGDHTDLPEERLYEDFAMQPGYATPKVDVRGAVVRDGEILLVQERVDGLWCMPGGWADVGDLPSEMVTREVWEESGYRVVPTNSFFCARSPAAKPGPATRRSTSDSFRSITCPHYRPIALTSGIWPRCWPTCTIQGARQPLTRFHPHPQTGQFWELPDRRLLPRLKGEYWRRLPPQLRP